MFTITCSVKTRLISKAQFLRQYGKFLVLNSCDRQLGTRLFLTLYIRVAVSCRCLLYIESVAQHQTVLRVLSFEYSHDRQLGKRLFLTSEWEYLVDVCFIGLVA